jgi:hypothetical protein
VAFGEKKGTAVRRATSRREHLFSANLLEAELRSALAREGVPWSDRLVAPIAWILPPRSLGAEMERALKAGQLRGADLWHIACALYIREELGQLIFLTLDERQRSVAGALEFETPKL